METKKCKKCGEFKPINNFGSYRVNNQVYIRHSCIKCLNRDRYDNNKTINGLIGKIYHQQRGGCARRGLPLPNYTVGELRSWIKSQSNFKSLYYNWINSGYDKLEIPSCDRINDYKYYSLDNIRLVTFRENRDRYYEDAKNGINTKICRSIIQMTIDGVDIKEHYSINSASRDTDIDPACISRVCRGKVKTAGGFKWRYANP